MSWLKWADPSFFISLWDIIGDDVTSTLYDMWDTCYARFPYKGPYSSHLQKELQKFNLIMEAYYPFGHMLQNFGQRSEFEVVAIPP